MIDLGVSLRVKSARRELRHHALILRLELRPIWKLPREQRLCGSPREVSTRVSSPDRRRPIWRLCGALRRLYGVAHTSLLTSTSTASSSSAHTLTMARNSSGSALCTALNKRNPCSTTNDCDHPLPKANSRSHL